MHRPRLHSTSHGHLKGDGVSANLEYVLNLRFHCKFVETVNRYDVEHYMVHTWKKHTSAVRSKGKKLREIFQQTKLRALTESTPFC